MTIFKSTNTAIKYGLKIKGNLEKIIKLLRIRKNLRVRAERLQAKGQLDPAFQIISGDYQFCREAAEVAIGKEHAFNAMAKLAIKFR